MADDEELDDRISRFQSLSISFIFSNREPTKRKIPSEIKEKLKSAAGEKCPLCPNTMISSSIKKTPLHERESTPDHILDLGLGGNNTEENFLILCHKCNWAKNHAMQRHLTISGMAGGTPGHKPWRVAFRRKGSNIAKLMEYVEWSFRIEEPSCEHRFPELHGYFMQDRFGKSEEPISTSSKRLEKPENTLWSRFARFLGGLFGGKPEKRRINLLTEPSEFPKLDFTPGDFAAGLLRQKKREQPVTFTTLYDRLIKEDPSFNLKNLGIKPSKYLVSNCSDLLLIEFKKPHHWISKIHVAPPSPGALPFTPEEFVKGLLRQRTREGQMTYNFLYGLLIKENPKFNLSHYGIKPSSYLQEECSSILSIEKRMHKNGTSFSFWINDKPEVQRNIVSDLTVDSSKIILSARESATKSADNQIAKQRIRIARTNTHAKDPTVEDFRAIILDIIGVTPDSKISISALGQRFSKRVQELGFTNKREFFTSVGISSSLTISKAIGEYFEDNEIIIDGDHVLGNRRD